MLVPDFLLRKLYKRGSLHETGPGRFSFALQNPLGPATVMEPPIIVVNGVRHEPSHIKSAHDLAGISADNPLRFKKGDQIILHFRGHLMRGGNRIHIAAVTKEFGAVDLFVEDTEAIFCDVPSGDAEE